MDKKWSYFGAEGRLLRSTFIIGLLLGINSWKGILVGEGSMAALGFVLVLLVAVAMARNLPENWIYTTFLDDKKEGRKPVLGNVLRWLLPYGVALLAGLVVGMLAGLM